MRRLTLITAALCVLAGAAQAQDTTKIKALAGRVKQDTDSISSANKLSGAQQQKNERAKARIDARQDSIITYVHAPIVDTTTPPPADTTTYVDILPGASIQAAVNANPVNTKFRLKAGTHTRQQVQPKTGQTFRGEGNLATIMDGGNVTQYAFYGYSGSAWVNTVTIKNIDVRNYAPPAQRGAITLSADDTLNSTSGWILDSLDVHNNAGIGIRVGNRARVLRTKTHHNGTMGIGGVGRAILIDGVESTYNNPGCVNNPGFESGGSKFVYTDSLEVKNSTWSYNCGVGLWLDIWNHRYSLHDNVVLQNYREGICVEVSMGGFNGARNKIYNNTVTGNGIPVDSYRANGWLWDAGIGIHASDSVEVYNNTLSENYNGIVIIQQPRNTSTGDSYAPVGGFIARAVYVHNNTITQRVTQPGGEGGSSGAVQDAGDNATFSSRNNVWAANTYYLGSNPRPFAWMNGYRTKDQWQAYGQDTAGIFNP